MATSTVEAAAMLRLGLSYLEARPGQWGEGGGKGEESNRREARGVGREAGAQSEGQALLEGGEGGEQRGQRDQV